MPGEDHKRAISFALARKGIPAAPCTQLWRVAKMHSDFLSPEEQRKACIEPFFWLRKGLCLAFGFVSLKEGNIFAWTLNGAAGVLVTLSSL